MDLSNVRRMSKQQYETVREQLEELGDRVTSRHGEDGVPVRTGYRRFLGALDELAGRLLDDEEISQRGQDLLRDKDAAGPADGAADGTAGPDEANEAATSGDSAWATAEAEADAADAEAADQAKGPDMTDVTEDTAGTSGVAGAGAGAAGAEAGVASETDVAETGSAGSGPGEPGTAGSGAAASGPAEVPVGESWAAANARVAEEHAESGQAGTTDAAAAAQAGRTVDVVFSLPAGVQADRVALCGEFNDWSPESTMLAHQGDGTWSVTVPLAPGTYRYKYLLDGETWENGPGADRYEENAYGTQDSVIEVS